MKYTPVIGLEVHVELKTKSKMFCGCEANYFGKKPNTQTCPVCLGLPGALPVPNKQAIEWCVAIGMALGCEILPFAKFDRKNYFYPDLSKGYQISQYDEPFAINGKLTLSNGKTIRIRRAHMEEDTGKLIHDNINNEKVSLIDFNRSGVPLVEIVTEPDFDNAADVKEYLQKLQQVVRYLGVADADMEKGNMRLEPNISLKSETEQKENKLPKYKVEVKNINSFNFVAKTIEYEIKRQTEILDEGNLPAQETRGWDEKRQKTYSQRAKEEANDYRYFPEPDIPPVRWTKEQLAEIKKSMPELPSAKQDRFMTSYMLPAYDAEILIRDKALADYFEECISVIETLDLQLKEKITAKTIANWIINKKPNIQEVLAAQLVEQIAKQSQTATMDDSALGKILDEVLAENEKAVSDYKSGKENVIMFLVGQVMRKAKQKLDANFVKQHLQEKLKV